MGSLFGGKTKSEKAAEQSFQGKFDPLIAQQTAASQGAMARANPLLDQSNSTLSGPLNFWNTMASGNRGAMSKLLGPELDAVGERDAANKQAFSQFAPRGSSMGQRLGEQSQGTTSDINRMFLNLRPEAMDKMTELSQLLFGEGSTLFNAATGTAGNTLGNLLQNRGLNQQSQQMRQAGNSNIFRAANFLWGGVG